MCYRIVPDARGVAYHGTVRRACGDAIAGHATHAPIDSVHAPVALRLLRMLRPMQPELNHLIMTRYNDDARHLPGHTRADMLDGAFVFWLGFGRPRDLQLVAIADGRLARTVRMHPGSLFVLGPRTNRTHYHRIVSTAPPGAVAPHIAACFRAVPTFKDAVAMAAVRRQHAAALGSASAAGAKRSHKQHALAPTAVGSDPAATALPKRFRVAAPDAS
jgi:hypothetical protein